MLDVEESQNEVVISLDFITKLDENAKIDVIKGGENPEKKDQLLRRILPESPG
jgi:hypothetical protein